MLKISLYTLILHSKKIEINIYIVYVKWPDLKIVEISKTNKTNKNKQNKTNNIPYLWLQIKLYPS